MEEEMGTMNSAEWRKWLEGGKDIARSCADSYGRALIDEMRGELPELTGTPKQVNWAEDIRGDMLAAVAMEGALRAYKTKNIDKSFAQVEMVVRHLMTHTTARWWIDSRMDPLLMLEMAAKELSK